MRICFIMAALPHYFALIMNKMVSESGHDLTLIKPAGKSIAVGSAVKEDTSGANFRIIELKEHRQWYGKPFFNDLIPAIRKVDPDIVVMSAWPYFLHFALTPTFYWKFKKLGTKLICRDIPFNVSYWGKSREFYFSGGNRTENMTTVETPNIKGFLAFTSITLLRKIYLNLADAHINYYEQGKEITASYGVPREKIFVVSNSPDTDKLLAVYEQVSTQEAILPENGFRLIHVGRLVKWKRVDMLIRSIHSLQCRFPEIELIVVGSGPEEGVLKSLGEELQVANRIRFVGAIYDLQILGKYLHASSVYLLAGMGGLSINDAMCFGKPIICAVADGTEKRLVRDGHNGYYFKNDNQASLNDTIELLVSDQDKVRKFGENSLNIIRKEINIHTMLNEYDAAFEYVSLNDKAR